MKKKFISMIITVLLLFVAVIFVGGCGGDSGHKHVFDRKVVSEQYLRSAGSCTEKATYYKSCECGEAGTEYFETEGSHLENVITAIKPEDDKYRVHYKCLDCGVETEKALEESEIKDMPILNIRGSLDGVSKDKKVKVEVDYFNDAETEEFASYATLKVQGGSSAGFPKKNYNIQLYKDDTYDKKNKIVLRETWGKQSKYTLKANWIDYSQARNVVSGKLYGKIAMSNKQNDGIEKAPNGGAVDGYPIIIFYNGEFLGLYTLNIAKDDWMFGLKDDEELHSAILMADNWNTPVYLTKDVTKIVDDASNTEGFVCEFQGDEAKDADIIASFNAFTQALRQVNSKEDLLAKLPAATIARGIDSMLFTYVICAPDNTAKNITYVTYDGTVWLPSVYDMDGTWGLYWNGQMIVDAEKSVVPSASLGTLLWQCLYKYDFNEVVSRYKELRETLLSYENIIAEFDAFDSKIPAVVRKTERNKWKDVPSQDTNNLEQIKEFTKKRLEFLDNSFGFCK
ncbi:MAG: CotH kinase family protein [Synergistaceae bacterium]|nr:CotH kinase family protein [Synergistaceae bacterium]